jgi:hypothetical protein
MLQMACCVLVELHLHCCCRRRNHGRYEVEAPAPHQHYRLAKNVHTQRRTGSLAIVGNEAARTPETSHGRQRGGSLTSDGLQATRNYSGVIRVVSRWRSLRIIASDFRIRVTEGQDMRQHEKDRPECSDVTEG